MRSTYDVNKLKEYEVDILDKFKEICDEHNITYYIAFGTLLGAIRHKGFIPWDDDIDVHLRPEDYYKFKEIMKSNPYKGYFYQAFETDKYYPLPFAKLRMNNTEVVETKLKEEPIHKGIYIDIFPLIPYPENIFKQKRVLSSIKIINLLIEADLHNKKKYITYGKAGKIISKALKILPRKLRNDIAIKKLKRIVLYKGKYNKYIDIIDKISFDKNYFNDTKNVSFENKTYKAPKDYDKLLTSIYGNYMQLPKEKDRKNHSFEKVLFIKEKENE